MISSAYSYYLSHYAARETARTDSAARRPGDLRRAYSRMLGINRLAPAYKTDVSIEAQKYAIDLKENARELSSIADELSGSDDDSFIIRQSAISDNPDAVSAVYIGNGSSGASAFEVSVHQLATTQINTGNYLPPASRLLEPGDYSFDLNMCDITYEFEFGVSSNDTSKSIQEKLARLINRSNIGLSADICNDDMGNTALRIESVDTGVSGMKPVIFDFKDNETLLHRIPTQQPHSVSTELHSIRPMPCIPLTATSVQALPIRLRLIRNLSFVSTAFRRSL